MLNSKLSSSSFVLVNVACFATLVGCGGGGSSDSAITVPGQNVVDSGNVDSGTAIIDSGSSDSNINKDTGNDSGVIVIDSGDSGNGGDSNTDSNGDSAIDSGNKADSSPIIDSSTNDSSAVDSGNIQNDSSSADTNNDTAEADAAAIICTKNSCKDSHTQILCQNNGTLTEESTCSSSTPFCIEETGSCGGCLSDIDCPSDITKCKKGVCNNHVCTTTKADVGTICDSKNPMVCDVGGYCNCKDPYIKKCSPEDICGTTDIYNDLNNCGACGNVCPLNTDCVKGMCKTTTIVDWDIMQQKKDSVIEYGLDDKNIYYSMVNGGIYKTDKYKISPELFVIYNTFPQEYFGNLQVFDGYVWMNSYKRVVAYSTISIGNNVIYPILANCHDVKTVVDSKYIWGTCQKTIFKIDRATKTNQIVWTSGDDEVNVYQLKQDDNYLYFVVGTLVTGNSHFFKFEKSTQKVVWEYNDAIYPSMNPYRWVNIMGVDNGHMYIRLLVESTETSMLQMDSNLPQIAKTIKFPYDTFSGSYGNSCIKCIGYEFQRYGDNLWVNINAGLGKSVIKYNTVTNTWGEFKVLYSNVMEKIKIDSSGVYWKDREGLSCVHNADLK